MSLSAITKSNIVSQSWQNVYDIVETVSDPKSRGVQWIFAAFPQARKSTADVYPCIIIESPNIDGENIVLSHANRRYLWTIPISIYDTRMSRVDTVADSVLGTLETKKGSLETNGMLQINFGGITTFHAIIANQVIHEKRINVTCEGFV